MTSSQTAGGAESYDVVVAGAGMAGSVAALVAAQAGRRVLLVDAAADPSGGGNTALSGGAIHVGRADLRADPDILRERMLGRALGEVRTDVIEAIATTAGPAMNWLLSKGVPLLDKPPGDIKAVFAPERPLADLHAWKERGPQLALRTLQSSACTAGAVIVADTRVEELALDASGTVTGVVTDSRATYHAPAVVLADGGFQADRALVGRHLSPAPDKLFLRGAPTSTGAGLRMAESAGAVLVNMEWLYGHCLHADVFHNDRLWPWPALDEVLTDGGILIGPDGRRLVDEGRGGVYAANVVARLENPAGCWVIIDAALWDETAGHEIWGHQAANPELERRGARIERADNAAALAAAIGCESDTLVQTLADYSDAADAGTAGSQRPVPRTGVVRAMHGRLVAFPLAVGLSHTAGGPAIDADGRVLRADGPIPGLFAAGCGAASASAGYFGGLASALTIAWRAGHVIAGNSGR